MIPSELVRMELTSRESYTFCMTSGGDGELRRDTERSGVAGVFRFRTSIKDRMLLLVACQTMIAILLIATSLRVESKAIQSYYRVHWILALAIVTTALACFLSVRLTMAAAARVQKLVYHV